MIKTKEDLRRYIQADLARFGGKAPGIYNWFMGNEDWYIWQYTKRLRRLEYYINNKDKSLWHKFMWLLLVWIHKHESLKTGLAIAPNSVGPGLRIYHMFGVVATSRYSKIGKNFTCRPGCVICSNIDGQILNVEIGDNVEFSIGVIVMCKKIGRGSIINANAVLTSNIPPYAIVMGNPAKVVGFTKTPKEIIEYELANYTEEDRLSYDLLRSNYEKYFLNRIKEIKSIYSLKN